MDNYILISPAKNEEKCIEKTIHSVINQTHLPEEWVIVSDNSTDNTDNIIKSYAEKYTFIKYIRNESNAGKDFSSKVNAFNKGLAALQYREYNYLGNLDADVSFDSNYYLNMINILKSTPQLGLVGGLVKEFRNNKIYSSNKSLNSVSGAVQLFKRKCFEDIGGYIPLKIGGIDTAAEICARAKGWGVKTYPEFTVLHYGPVLTGSKNRFKMLFKMGISNYQLGYHPVFQAASSIRRILQKPFILGALCYLAGFTYASLKRMNKNIPQDIISYLQKEQISRLLNILKV